LICAYLIADVIFYTSQLRSLWLSYAAASESIPPTYTVSHTLYLPILLAECLPKTKFLMHEEDRARSPEDKCGIISKSFLAWMNPVITTGYWKLATIDDLYPPPMDLSPELVEEVLWWEWEKSKLHNLIAVILYRLICTGKYIKKHCLLFAMALTLKVRRLKAIIPKIRFIGFVICQPLLLKRLVEFLHGSSESQDIGYVLIGAYAILFVGIAVSAHIDPC
jgi:ATP-binding cassette subfamily C (CFTR/MRP) protein 1